MAELPSHSKPGLAPISTQPENALLQRFRGRELRRKWRSGHQRDTREQPSPPPHRLPLMRSAEKATPQAAQGHWHHRSRRLFENALKAGAKCVELARVGQPSLGKDADNFSRVERFRGLLEGAFLHRRIFFRRSDRYRVHVAEDEIQHRNAKNPMIHDKTYRPPHARRDDDRIDIADMVADDHAAAG